MSKEVKILTKPSLLQIISDLRHKPGMGFGSTVDNEAIHQARDSAIRMENRDIRAKILRLIYNKQMNAEEVNLVPQDYSKLLGVSEDLVNVNVEYLVNSGLADGKVFFMPGSNKIQTTRVWRLTALGIEVVEGTATKLFDINYNIVVVNAPVTGGQIASGHHITQTQTVSINNFRELYEFMDKELNKSQNAVLKPLVEKLEAEMKTDSAKVSTIRKIKEAVTTYGPVGVTIIETVLKLSGIKP